MRGGRLQITLAVFLGALLFAALTYVNHGFVRNSPGGNDFLPRWLGTRLFIIQHQDPYGAETTAAIQEMMYGRAAKQGEDQALFAYPLFAMVFFAPFSLIGDYTVARALWMTTQEVAVAATAVAAIALAGWKPNRWALAAFLIFSLTWFHGTKPLIDGNVSILVGLLIALGLLVLKRGEDGLAGFLFALSTIKPQIVALSIVVIVIWTISKRRRFVISFLISIGALIGLSLLAQPNWLGESVGQAMIYPNYSPPGTIFAIFEMWWGELGYMIGLAVSVGFALLLLYEWWAALGKEFDWFLWTACLTLVIGPFLGVPWTTSNYVVFLFLLPVLFGFWQRRGSQLQIWFDLIFLFLVPWTVFLLTLGQGQQFRENLVMFFPVPLYLIARLYWQRGWAQHPPVQPTLRAREV